LFEDLCMHHKHDNFAIVPPCGNVESLTEVREDDESPVSSTELKGQEGRMDRKENKKHRIGVDTGT